MKFISGGSGLLEMLNLDRTTRYQTIRMVDELRNETEVLLPTCLPARLTVPLHLSQPRTGRSGSSW